MKRNAAVTALVVSAVIYLPVTATAQESLSRAANLTAIAEAALSTASLVQDYLDIFDGGVLEEIQWSATYTQRHWIFRASGNAGEQTFSFTMVGYLWGDEDQDWSITYTGLGQLREEPIFISGRSDWILNQEDLSYSYTDMEFRHVVKFGESSYWGWVVGGEAILGGTIGAGGAIAGASLVTGGLALGAAAWIGSAGALTGATALISASDTAKSLISSEELESDGPPDAPPLPERPLLEPGVEFEPEEGITVIAIAVPENAPLSDAGDIVGHGPGQSYEIMGTFEAGEASGMMVQIK